MAGYRAQHQPPHRCGKHSQDVRALVRNGPMNAGQVAAALGVTTAAISAMASRLGAGGYAWREIDPIDRRRILLHPSPTGAQQAFGLFDDLYRASVELGAQIPEQDLRRLMQVLQRYRALLGRRHEIDVRAVRSIVESPAVHLAEG